MGLQATMLGKHKFCMPAVIGCRAISTKMCAGRNPQAAKIVHCVRCCARCFVPTQYCKRSALKNGLKEEQIVVHGLPIRPVFNKRLGPKEKLRKRLGLDKRLPTVLLVGAGSCCTAIIPPDCTTNPCWSLPACHGITVVAGKEAMFVTWQAGERAWERSRRR